MKTTIILCIGLVLAGRSLVAAELHRYSLKQGGVVVFSESAHPDGITYTLTLMADGQADRQFWSATAKDLGVDDVFFMSKPFEADRNGDWIAVALDMGSGIKTVLVQANFATNEVSCEVLTTAFNLAMQSMAGSFRVIAPSTLEYTFNPRTGERHVLERLPDGIYQFDGQPYNAQHTVRRIAHVATPTATPARSATNIAPPAIPTAVPISFVPQSPSLIPVAATATLSSKWPLLAAGALAALGLGWWFVRRAPPGGREK